MVSLFPDVFIYQNIFQHLADSLDYGNTLFLGSRIAPQNFFLVPGLHRYSPKRTMYINVTVYMQLIELRLSGENSRMMIFIIGQYSQLGQYVDPTPSIIS